MLSRESLSGESTAICDCCNGVCAVAINIKICLFGRLELEDSTPVLTEESDQKEYCNDLPSLVDWGGALL